jgi:hypothetical protein
MGKSYRCLTLPSIYLIQLYRDGQFGEGNRKTQRKWLTFHTSLTNFIEYTSQYAGIKL